MAPSALAFLLLAAAPAALAKGDVSGSLLEQALETGDWNQRIRAVNQLGAMQPPALVDLRRALADPDWQVRLTAVHWLGRAGPGAGPALQEALRSESCPLVRLALVHGLGSLRLDATAARSQEELDGCESWFWPTARASPLSRKASVATLEASRVDIQGCQYVRYKAAGRNPCPQGTAVRGVGPAPESIDFLGSQAPPTSGVALCCPVQGPATARAPEDVECRLVPVECPAGWTEMAPKEDFNWSGKDMQYKRTYRLQEGDLQWIHCCRPHGPEREEPREDEAPPQAPAPEDSDLPQMPPPPAAEKEPLPEGMPEKEAWLKAMAREPKAAAPEPKPGPVPRDARLAELDSLLDADPQSLPRPKGLPERPPAQEAQAVALDAPGRAGAAASLEARRGEVSALPSPQGLPGRDPGRVRAPAEVMPDAGAPPTHDPLPALLELLKHKEARKRSRAADELGAMGRRAAPAARALKAALSDSSPRVRASAALALGNVTEGSDEAVESLRRALKDRHVDVRYSAAQALGRIGTPASQRAFNAYMRAEAHAYIFR